MHGRESVREFRGSHGELSGMGDLVSLCPLVPLRARVLESGRLLPENTKTPGSLPVKSSMSPPSGRRRGVAPRRPPTPPYVRFRIRRFLFNNSSRGLFGQGLRGQVGSENESGPPDSCGWRQHSTRDLGHSSHGSTLSRGPGRGESVLELESWDASTAAIEWHAVSDGSIGQAAQTSSALLISGNRTPSR